MVAADQHRHSKWPNIKAYPERVAARPKVQEALKAERLIPEPAAPVGGHAR